MRKKTVLYSILAFALAVTFLSAQDANVAGEWDMTTQGRQGERTRTITITQDGSKITVTMPGMRGGDPTVAEGKVEGNKIEWTVTRSTQRGEFTIIYKGTVEGDTMTGTSEFQGMDRTSEWSAKKK